MENNNKKQSSSHWFRAQSSNSNGNPPMSDYSSFNTNNFSSRRINSSSFSNNTNIRGNHSNNVVYVVKDQKKVDSKAEGSDVEHKKNTKINDVDDETYDFAMKNTIRSKNFRTTLSPLESLPPNEQLGGYIFVCNNETMQENLEKNLFGLPPRYRDSVKAITPGMPIFLYNFTTHKLHGIFQAASFGGTNIDPTAWEDKRNPGESNFPAQVRVTIRKTFEPLDDETFRQAVHHYDGPKFRLELTSDEALHILQLFAEQNFEEVFKVTYY